MEEEQPGSGAMEEEWPEDDTGEWEEGGSWEEAPPKPAEMDTRMELPTLQRQESFFVLDMDRIARRRLE